MRRLISCFLAILATVVVAGQSLAQALEPHTRTLSFGTVVGYAPVERPLTVTNRGTAPVRIRNVELSAPLSVSRVASVVEPGQSADIVITFGLPRPSGRFEGEMVVTFDGNAEALAVEVAAIVVPPFEIIPGTELDAVTERGSRARASVDIVNNLDHPVELSGATSNERFATTLEMIEPGRRYRLHLDMTGRGAAGQRIDSVTLRTGDANHPEVRIRARTMLRERVYTVPGAVDFGRISAGGDTDKAPDYSASITVYEKDGQNFEVTASSDLPFVAVRPERSREHADRWEIFCSIDPARAAKGRIEGSLLLVTNDPEFSSVTVPVVGFIE
jgi:hypothetical protein